MGGGGGTDARDGELVADVAVVVEGERGGAGAVRVTESEAVERCRRDLQRRRLGDLVTDRAARVRRGVDVHVVAGRVGEDFVDQTGSGGDATRIAVGRVVEVDDDGPVDARSALVYVRQRHDLVGDDGEVVADLVVLDDEREVDGAGAVRVTGRQEVEACRLDGRLDGGRDLGADRSVRVVGVVDVDVEVGRGVDDRVHQCRVVVRAVLVGAQCDDDRTGRTSDAAVDVGSRRCGDVAGRQRGAHDPGDGVEREQDRAGTVRVAGLGGAE